MPQSNLNKSLLIQGKLLVIIVFINLLSVFGSISQSQASHSLSALDSLAESHYGQYLQSRAEDRLENALYHLQSYADINDSIVYLKRFLALEKIYTGTSDDRKEQEINMLINDSKINDLRIKQNRIIIIVISGVSLLLLLIIIQSVRLANIRADQHALALKQDLLRSQMNPHFIFNALTNIQSFIARKDERVSLKYLDHFSDLVETILDSSVRKNIDLKTELGTLGSYLELQKLRFGEKLNFNIAVAPELEPAHIKLPPMLIQPLVENAIEHGIKPKKGPGHINIRFIKKDDALIIEVEDDGVGRRIDPKSNGSQTHTGLALVIIRERLESMSKGRGRKNSLDIIDLFDHGNKPAGMLVRLIIYV